MIEYYKTVKDKYVAKVLYGNNRNAFYKDLSNLIREYNHPITVKTKIYLVMYRLKVYGIAQRIKSLLKKITMKIIFCGDVMPGGVLPYQKEYITEEVKTYLKSFDLRIGTLETAIGTGIPYDETKMNGRMDIVYARNEDFFRVTEMNFDVVSLANNHVFDLGEVGLRNTIDILKKNNIKFCGAGLNYEEASRPAVIECGDKSIAILAYCMYGNKYLGYVELAEKDKAGVNPLNIDQAVADIRKYKQMYDYVVVMPHWGREYQYLPMLECKDMSLQMIDAGADAIIGGHAHNIQPCIKYKGKLIYYCLANFLFPDYYMHPPRPIWYPDSSYDVKSISKSYCYPDHIEKTYNICMA